MPKVCQDMHKCHNYHAILHKLYLWFGKNELRLYLNRAKNFRLGGGAADFLYDLTVFLIIW